MYVFMHLLVIKNSFKRYVLCLSVLLESLGDTLKFALCCLSSDKKAFALCHLSSDQKALICEMQPACKQ